MKLSETMKFHPINRMTIGETYNVTGARAEYKPDKYNSRRQRLVIVLTTDKGDFYAPGATASSAQEELEEGARLDDVLALFVGHAVRCSSYWSKVHEVHVPCLEWLDDEE